MSFSLNVEMLETHNLKQNFENNWFEKQVTAFKAKNAQLVDTENQLEEFEPSIEQVEEFIKSGNQLQAAIFLSEMDDLQYEKLDGLSGFEYAIAVELPEIVFALLALERSQVFYKNSALPFAVAMNSPLCFNLLLLSKQFDVNTDCFIESEYIDLAGFCGFHHYGKSFIPHIWLQKPEYHASHRFLDIDWELGFGEYDAPIMYHAYQNDNYEMMNRLVGLGAEINPSLTSGDCANLFHQMLWDWQDDNPDTHKGLEWFAKFSDFLTCDIGSESPASLFVLNREGTSTTQAELFDFGIQYEIESDKQELRDERIELQDNLSDLHRKLGSFEKELFEVADKRVLRQSSSVSIYADLQRLKKVSVNQSITDIQVSVNKDDFTLAVWKDKSAFPVSASFPIKLIHQYLDSEFSQLLSINPDELSPLQLLALCLHVKPEIWLSFNLIFQEKQTVVFDSIKGCGISDASDWRLLQKMYSHSSVDDPCSYTFDREILKYNELFLFLIESGILSADSNYLYNFNKSNKTPVSLNLAEVSSPHLIKVSAAVDEEKLHEVSVLIGHKEALDTSETPAPDLIRELLDVFQHAAPFAKACNDCKGIKPFFELADGVECMVCINNEMEF
ncbi:hypothetical protein JQC92_00880 [Shewanella sp. 202IG2-18]|uniref:hypothetical protein n=1 Tax=Parashewanella hymeniacidonis TaxID=2807618 RepID=UPI0019606336|nr:hypothetical protein [Parashewanella hymeniacidonis]MBM7070599.1 hypothetical protein [Parashewanella hymeniacidonis]